MNIRPVQSDSQRVMATAACSTFQIRQGSFPSVRSPSSSRSTGPLVSSIRSEISSDAHFASSRRIFENRGRRLVLTRAMTDDRVDMDENPEGIISGEWPENFSLLCYDDLRAYLETQILEEDQIKRPSVLLSDVMSIEIRTARADQTLGEIEEHFEFVSGLPVVDHELRCVGVISKSDRDRASAGMNSKVAEVMSSPAVTLTPDKTIMDAAALMLRKKIHRIPLLNKDGKIVGMVTRSDIFQALETVMA